MIEPVAQLIARHTQQRGSSHLVAAALLQRLAHQEALDAVEEGWKIEARGREVDLFLQLVELARRAACHARVSYLAWEVLRSDPLAIAQNLAALDNAAELAYVAWPGIALQ